MDQNVNRIDHVTWAAFPENQDDYVTKLSALGNTSFDGPIELREHGLRVWLSWESGLEVMSPVDPDASFAAAVWAFLHQRGEGVFAVVFGVPDLDEATARARSLGFTGDFVIDDLGPGPWSERTESFKEIAVGEIMNTVFAFGEITYRPGAFRTAGATPEPSQDCRS